MSKPADTMESIVALCRRRGFIFGSSEIYGGIGGFWDYGPLGTELKRNIKDAWWEDMVRNPPPGPNGVEYQMVGLDCSIIMNPKVWEASGHVTGFGDMLVDCKECKGRFREDVVYQVHIQGFRRSEIVHQEAVSGTGESGLAAATDLAKRLVEGAPWSQVVPQDDGTYAVWWTKEGARRIATYGVLADSSEQARLATVPFASKIVKKERLVFWRLLPRTLDFQGDRPIVCPGCQSEATLTEPREFNLMFQTHIGALQDSSSLAYLRPETAQGIFVNFKNVMDTSRVKLPFGIAQIGKAFRNEINPRNYTFRSREFEQMEIEFFCRASEADTWYEYWRDLRHQWYVRLGLKSDKLRLRDHEKDELAHYADACADVEYAFPFGVAELEGIANRTDFDLKAHQEKSGKDLTYFDDERKERYIPYVIEPSAGVDRFALAILCEAYSYDEKRASPEFMTFHPRLAPIKAAVFPLVAKDGLPDIAEPIYREIKRRFPCQYDAKQSIGKRYARMDEAGTPFCFTIDGQTKKDGTVTVRDRDDASQIRIDKSRCAQYLHDQLAL